MKAIMTSIVISFFVIGVSVLVSLGSSSREVHPLSTDLPLKHEIILSKSLGLRDVFQRVQGNETIPIQWDIKKEELVSSLNRCKLYVIGKKTWKNGTWSFLDPAFPKILVEGELSFTLKDKKQQHVELCIVDVEQVAATYHAFGGAVPTCSFELVFRVKKLNAQGGMGITSETVTFRTKDRLCIETNGKVTWKH